MIELGELEEEVTGSNASVRALAAELAENRNPCSISGFHREVGKGSHSEAAEREASQGGMCWARVVLGSGNGFLAALGPQLTSPVLLSTEASGW